MRTRYQKICAEIEQRLNESFPNGIAECEAANLLSHALLSPLDHWGPVELSEYRGLQLILSTDLLPISMAPDRLAFEKLGFVFGQIDTEVWGPGFLHSRLPEGWTKCAGDDNRFSYIRDEDNVKRVEVFYKDTPYEKRARMRILPPGFPD